MDNDGNVISNDNINKFGDCDEKNIYITKLVNADNKNENANPNEGESYAIVTIKSLTDEEISSLDNEDIGSNVIPYHIATVIYKSGDINITLEAAEDPSITEKQPQFSFYTTKEGKTNFHTYRKGIYDKYNKERNGSELLMNTIVLMSRDKDILLNEIRDSDEYKKQPNVLSTHKKVEKNKNKNNDNEKNTLPNKITGGKSNKKTKKNIKNTQKKTRQSKLKKSKN